MMPKGQQTSPAIREEITRAILAGERTVDIAARTGVSQSAVLHLSTGAVVETLKPRLLMYIAGAGRVNVPADIPTAVTRNYGIHRTVHVLQVLRREDLIKARQAGGRYNIRDIELTERGQAVAARLGQNGQAEPVVETPPFEPLVEQQAETYIVASVDFTVPLYPILAKLRERIVRRSERARLLEAAAELADDDDDGVQLLEQAEKARAGANTPIEDEYLAFAARYLPEE